jgi:hypothetical protein
MPKKQKQKRSKPTKPVEEGNPLTNLTHEIPGPSKVKKKGLKEGDSEAEERREPEPSTPKPKVFEQLRELEDLIPYPTPLSPSPLVGSENDEMVTVGAGELQMLRASKARLERLNTEIVDYRTKVQQLMGIERSEEDGDEGDEESNKGEERDGENDGDEDL